MIKDGSYFSDAEIIISLNDAIFEISSYSTGEIDERGKYAYSGCLEGRGFDETGDKGFVLIDVNDKKAEYNSAFLLF